MADSVESSPTPGSPDPASRSSGPEADAPQSELFFSVASGLEDVLVAWGLVYETYQRQGLIDPHEFRIHTSPQAASRNAAVITGRLHGQTVSTLTGIRDSGAGLPLDSVYRRELDALRTAGHRLTEVGLFADRRSDFSRAVGALLGLMRFAFYYGWTGGWTEIVIGVHPHHVRFYEQVIGFEVMGPTLSYGAVRGNPVVPLCLDPDSRRRSTPLPRGLAVFLRERIEEDAFEGRCDFAPEPLAASVLPAYLEYQTGRTS